MTERTTRVLWHVMMSLDGFILERLSVGQSGPLTDLRFRVLKQPAAVKG